MIGNQPKQLLIFLLVLLLSTTAYAQDVHFSQRFALDRERNPAFLNHFEGKWQAYSVYRQQWQAIGVPFTTSTINYTRKFYTPISALIAFGGIQYTNDQSGDAKLLNNRIALNLGASYESDLGTFVFGVSNNLENKSYNQNGLTFPAQYDRNTGGFNEQLSNGEDFVGEQLSFYNLNVGLRWLYTLSDKWQLNSGFSVQNLTEPKESFMGTDNTKNRGYGIQLLADHTYSKSINILPYFSYHRAQKASEAIVGGAVLFNTAAFGPVNNIKPFLYMRTGFGRTTDAIILGSHAQLGDFQLGASYDFNISNLELASNYKGGFELTLLYRADYVKLKKRRLPCVRY
jgi:type IX secretion system PorP/SprF family membrane protein